MRPYRAITRHSDGRIINVRDIKAGSDVEAIRIVTDRGSDFRMDLWSDDGLVRRFGLDAQGGQDADDVTQEACTVPDVVLSPELDAKINL